MRKVVSVLVVGEVKHVENKCMFPSIDAAFSPSLTRDISYYSAIASPEEINKETGAKRALMSFGQVR